MNKKFYLKLILFVLPFVLFFSIPATVLYLSKEIFDIKEVIDDLKKDDTKYLVEWAYSGPTRYLKKNLALYMDPEIIVLGSSRTIGFTSEMFLTEKFYNFCNTISRTNWLNEFINIFPPNKNPEIILLGLDPWWFNEKYENSWSRVQDNFTSDLFISFDRI